MARTAAGDRLTQANRRRQLAVRAATTEDLARLWRAVQIARLSHTIDPFAAAAGVVIRRRRQQSATLTAEYLADYWEAELGEPAPPIPEVPDLPLGEPEGLIRGAALAGIIGARRSGMPPAAAMSNGFVKLSGSAARVVLGGGRQTTMAASGADRRANRWRRIPGSSACEWCQMLATRGAVFSADTADFEAHDHCGCTGELELR